MFRFSAPKWSPIEIDYLKANRDKMSENQLSLALAKSRNAIKRKLAELDGKPIRQKPNKRSIIGKRMDLGVFCRSAWEANTLRWLNFLGKKWQYEPKVFVFDKIKKGTVSYCPDILLEDGTWIEVKGFLDGQSKTALRRMKKFYPDEFDKLKAIVGSANTKAAEFFKELGVPIMAYYSDLNREFKNKIEGWE